jgi:uncharacterized C2H2 Zn-finger protein
MAHAILGSLTKLAQSREALKRKEQRIAVAEQRLLAQMNRTLSSLGYQLVSLNGRPATPRAVKRAAPKTLKCPECDRRFSYQMHVARHLSAMHRAKKNVGKTRRMTAKRRIGKAKHG